MTVLNPARTWLQHIEAPAGEVVVTSAAVTSYYDAHAKGKLRGFVEGNARVECAWATIERWVREAPRRILEVGCGIGDVSWRMSRRWAESEVVGLDISPRSLRVARKLFPDPRITFCEGPLVPGRLEGEFDLIVLMDVYEHIAVGDRPALHAALKMLRSDSGRIVLSFPTPRHLAWLRRHQPDQIQPVDEDITVETMAELARETDTVTLCYEEVGVWHEGDYAHAVLGVSQGWDGQPRAMPAGQHRPPAPLVPSRAARLERVRRKLGSGAYPSAS
jgi:SAM-dependent methyltransferase